MEEGEIVVINCVSPQLLLFLTPTTVTASDACWPFNHWPYGTVFHSHFSQSLTSENHLPFPAFPVHISSLPTFCSNLPLFPSRFAQSLSSFPSPVPSLIQSLPVSFLLQSLPLRFPSPLPRSSSLWERGITVAERKPENQPTLFLIFKASDCVMLWRGKGEESQGEEE